MVAALEDNFDQVADVLIGSGAVEGVVPKLARALDSIAGPAGSILTQQKKNFSDRVSRAQKDIDAREALGNKKADALKLRLAKAQQAMSMLEQQSSQVAALGGGGGLKIG